MPARPPRPCPTCRKLTTSTYCEVCAKTRNAEWNGRRERYRTSHSKVYKTPRWKQERAAFLASHPICAVCGARATVVDHISPHRGNEFLMWNQANWQALCFSHHQRKTNAGQ